MRTHTITLLSSLHFAHDHSEKFLNSLILQVIFLPAGGNSRIVMLTLARKRARFCSFPKIIWLFMALHHT